MKKLLALISDSYHEFKHVNTITCCAMFGAMAIVLGSFASINVTPNLKIGFGSLPNELVDYLFGPVVGAFFGGAMDLIKFMIKPDEFWSSVQKMCPSSCVKPRTRVNPLSSPDCSQR